MDLIGFFSEWCWKSPSIWTLIFWTILAYWSSRQLRKRVKYRRFEKLNSFTDGLFILGFIVLTTDLMWVLVCLSRFGPLYVSINLDSVWQMVFCALRDLVGILFCFLLIGNYFLKGIVKINKHTIIMYLVNLAFLLAWFYLAPSPAWTDWTYAIRYDYSFIIVLESFVISHAIGKSIVTILYLTIWRS